MARPKLGKEYPCAQCGTTVYLTPGRARRVEEGLQENVFCSPSCGVSYRNTHLSDETRARMSQARQEWWENATLEQREQFRERQSGKRPQTSEALKGKPKAPKERRSGAVVACAQCGREFWKYGYQLSLVEQGHFQNHFCSRECSAQYKHDNHQPNLVTCKVCGKEFHRQKSREKYNGGNHYCSKSCRNADYSGDNHHMWKGGRRVRDDGYVDVAKSLVPPEYHCMLRKAQNVVMEHRLVMAMHLGRPLESWEVVHHVDHNRSNNDISNLELHSAHEHAGITASERKLLARIRELEAAAAKRLIDP